MSQAHRRPVDSGQYWSKTDGQWLCHMPTGGRWTVVSVGQRRTDNGFATGEIVFSPYHAFKEIDSLPYGRSVHVVM